MPKPQLLFNSSRSFRVNFRLPFGSDNNSFPRKRIKVRKNTIPTYPPFFVFDLFGVGLVCKPEGNQQTRSIYTMSMETKGLGRDTYVSSSGTKYGAPRTITQDMTLGYKFEEANALVT